MGNIENETHWFLQQILDETVYEHIKPQQLNQRFSLIERIVQSTSIESDEKKWCVEAIQLAKSLSEKRNLVAYTELSKFGEQAQLCAFMLFEYGMSICAQTRTSNKSPSSLDTESDS